MILVKGCGCVGGLLLKREYPSSPVVGVGAVIVECGRVVLVKRGAEPSLGKWSFPGGVVELGEKVRDAVVRETKEETGLDVELIRDAPMDAYDIFALDKQGRLWYHYVLLQFLVRPKQGVLKATSDVTDARWVSLEEAENYNLAESVRSFIKKHIKELQKH
ncbi:MAG: NUDIX hydrolase [Candidatus Bathyarchaeum sp.]|nr:MAG: NUDIX hydrolase [Candidatus Bathyarchaeum sp.]